MREGVWSRQKKIRDYGIQFKILEQEQESKLKGGEEENEKEGE